MDRAEEYGECLHGIFPDYCCRICYPKEEREAKVTKNEDGTFTIKF